MSCAGVGVVGPSLSTRQTRPSSCSRARSRRCPPLACLQHHSGEASEPDRPVFESTPPTGEVSLFEARDAIEACEGLGGAEGDACFLTFGLDCQQTRRWFSTVASLESALALPDENEDDDDTHDAKADPWNLPQPLNEIFALWSDTADELKRMHDSSAHQ